MQNSIYRNNREPKKLSPIVSPQNLNALKRLPFGKQLPIFIGSKLTLFPLNNNLAAYPFRHGKLLRKLEKTFDPVSNYFYYSRFYTFFLTDNCVYGYPSHRVGGIGRPLLCIASCTARSSAITGRSASEVVLPWSLCTGSPPTLRIGYVLLVESAAAAGVCFCSCMRISLILVIAKSRKVVERSCGCGIKK